MMLPQDSWLPPPERPVIEGDEVHVWRASLHLGAPELEALLGILTLDERLRAGRFHFQKDREGFIAARGILRRILGLYLEMPPDRIRFIYSQYGKPALSGDMSADSLRFNVSHAQEVALYAVASGRAVGLDIEHIRGDWAGVEIAERFFSRDEVSALRFLPPHQQTEAFFNCWTRKEAYLKALGEGLSHPLEQFTVSLAPGDPALLLSPDDPRGRTCWSLAALSPGRGYAGALAVEGEIGAIRRWQWTSPFREGGRGGGIQCP